MTNKWLHYIFSKLTGVFVVVVSVRVFFFKVSSKGPWVLLLIWFHIHFLYIHKTLFKNCKYIYILLFYILFHCILIYSFILFFISFLHYLRTRLGNLFIGTDQLSKHWQQKYIYQTQHIISIMKATYQTEVADIKKGMIERYCSSSNKQRKDIKFNSKYLERPDFDVRLFCLFQLYISFHIY